jgi:hypothetical protein
VSPFFAGLFDTLEGQLSEARDFGLDTPSIGGPEFSYEHLLLCLSLIRQAQLTVEEIKDHVARLESGQQADGQVVQ